MTTYLDRLPIFLIWSNEHRAWWAPNERGYTPWIEEAGRYTYEQAAAIVSRATLDGQLVVPRQSQLPSNYRAIDTVNEVMVLAPEWTPESDSQHARRCGGATAEVAS